MKKLALCVAVCTLTASMAFAQSSGSFNAAGTGAACQINGNTGTLNSGTSVNFLSTGVKTSNGAGVTLMIRPSLVTGLFTDTKISATIPSASADVGIQVCVSVDNNPNIPVDPTPCVTYDQRFQQISTQLFSTLSECSLSLTTIACTDNTGCPSGDFCSIAPGQSTGVCAAPNPLCNFDLVLSTLSAHSYDFVTQVPNGYHTITAWWGPTSGQSVNSGSSNVASCVGPGIVTVTQTKIFSQSGSTLSY